MAKNKKSLLFIGGIVLIFLVIGLTWFFGWGMGPKEKGPAAKPTPRAVQRELSEEQKPEIDLEINSDRSGAVLAISKIDPRFLELEYELIYLAEDEGQEIERGVAGGPMKISGGQVRETLLFGTESCTTGVCKRKIDKNVSGGTLIIRLIDADNQVWKMEKEFAIEKTSGGYKAVWQE